MWAPDDRVSRAADFDRSGSGDTWSGDLRHRNCLCPQSPQNRRECRLSIIESQNDGQLLSRLVEGHIADQFG